MNFFRAQIISSITTAILALCILAPIALKLSHALYEHEPLECISPGTVHVHEIEFDCDFQKFKLSTQYYSIPLQFESKLPVIGQVRNTEFYTFLNENPILHFSLRGPPVS